MFLPFKNINCQIILQQKLEFKFKYYNSFPNSGQNPIYQMLNLELEKEKKKRGSEETWTEGKTEMFVFCVLRSLTSCNVSTMPSWNLPKTLQHINHFLKITIHFLFFSILNKKSKHMEAMLKGPVTHYISSVAYITFLLLFTSLYCNLFK